MLVPNANYVYFVLKTMAGILMAFTRTYGQMWEILLKGYSCMCSNTYVTLFRMGLVLGSKFSSVDCIFRWAFTLNAQQYWLMKIILFANWNTVKHFQLSFSHCIWKKMLSLSHCITNNFLSPTLSWSCYLIFSIHLTTANVMHAVLCIKVFCTISSRRQCYFS